MSVSEKQTVEILKVLYKGAEILILDEPTAVLTPQETEKLFHILRKMKARGCAIIIITHKLQEVLSISDRVTILRKGKSIETVDTASCDARKLTELMVGRPVSLEIERPVMPDCETILKVVDLSVQKADGSVAIDDISFEIKRERSWEWQEWPEADRRSFAKPLQDFCRRKKELFCSIRKTSLARPLRRSLKRA